MAEDDVVEELREMDTDLSHRAADEIEFLRVKRDGYKAQVETYRKMFEYPAGEVKKLGSAEAGGLHWDKPREGKFKVYSGVIQVPEPGSVLVKPNEVLEVGYNDQGGNVILTKKPRT